MSGLILGPMARWASSSEATVWVETDAPCEVRVTPESGEAASERTFTVEGHHYAIVRVSGLPNAHKVVLVAATADGCTGDIGLAGGEPAKDVSPTELSLTLKPDVKTACTVSIKKDGDTLTVSESGICTAYHGLACSFNGTAVRLK